MEAKTILQEIQRLPLNKRFWVMEQTLRSIKNEGLSQQTETDHEQDMSLSFLSASEKSLAKDWLSTEDDRWDKIL